MQSHDSLACELTASEFAVSLVSTITSRQESPGLKPWLRQGLSVFTCSPCVFSGFPLPSKTCKLELILLSVPLTKTVELDRWGITQECLICQKLAKTGDDFVLTTNKLSQFGFGVAIYSAALCKQLICKSCG